MDMNALNKIQYGIYIISSKADGRICAQLVNSLFQVTAEPVKFAISISKQNFSCAIIEKAGRYAITALSEDAPFEFIGKFGFQSGRTVNKFEKVKYTLSDITGIPIILDYAAAVYETEIENKIDLDTHILFISKVMDMKIIDASKNTMTYDYYHKVKGGLTAKNAPTFIKRL
ncbi:MAG: flavin reductase family protein [Endomicrobium sp.]|jgi:ferric-chelate reductase [NAD(P)H]|nr:flavin reductase family protein [Endomicrobium sp.]